MESFCGLDVSMDEAAVCVVDDKDEVHLRTLVVTDPEACRDHLLRSSMIAGLRRAERFGKGNYVEAHGSRRRV